MLQGIADTHAVIWYLYGYARLSTKARVFIEAAASSGHQIGLSSITLAEIVYKLDRNYLDPIPIDTFTRLKGALDMANSVLLEIPFDRQIALAMFAVSWSLVPDMPDRIITATALYYGLPLITRDEKITKSGTVSVVW